MFGFTQHDSDMIELFSYDDLPGNCFERFTVDSAKHVLHDDLQGCLTLVLHVDK